MNEVIQINENLSMCLKKSPFDQHKDKPFLMSFVEGCITINFNELRGIDLEILAYEILDFVKNK